MLRMYRAWGLSENELRRLTSTRRHESTRSLEQYLGMRNKRFFSRGKRGVVSTAEIRVSRHSLETAVRGKKRPRSPESFSHGNGAAKLFTQHQMEHGSSDGDGTAHGLIWKRVAVKEERSDSCARGNAPDEVEVDRRDRGRTSSTSGSGSSSCGGKSAGGGEHGSGSNQATHSAAAAVEAKWLRETNALGIGPLLIATDGCALVLEWVEGAFIVDFLQSASTDSSRAQWVVRETLSQCAQLDAMLINKHEMTHPERHLVIGSCASGAVGLRVTMLDFERCTRAKRGKQRNVTQTAQFFGSQRLRTLLASKGLSVDVDAMRAACREYKQALTRASESECAAMRTKHDTDTGSCDGSDAGSSNDAVVSCGTPVCVVGICAALGCCDATK